MSSPSLINGDPWDDVLDALVTRARAGYPAGGKLGGLGMLYPDREFRPLNDDRSFRWFDPPTPNPTTGNGWKQLERWEAQSSAEGKLLEFLISITPPTTIRSCPGWRSDTGVTHIRLSLVFAHVRTEHAKPSPARLEAAEKSLPLRLPGENMRALITRQRGIHRLFRAAEEPLRPREEVRGLIEAAGGLDSEQYGFTIKTFVEHAGAMKDSKFWSFEDVVIDLGDDDVPSPSPLGQSMSQASREPTVFQGLATRLLAAADRTEDSARAAPPNQYGSQTAAHALSASDAEHIAAKAATQAATKVLAQGNRPGQGQGDTHRGRHRNEGNRGGRGNTGGNTGRGGNAGRRGNTGNGRNTFYCRLHGVNPSHNSPDCHRLEEHAALPE